MKRFDELYKHHYKLIYRIALRFLNNHENAADISQDVFMYLYKNMAQEKIIENEKAWLCKVTRNLCLAYLKKNQRIIGLSKEIITDPGTATEANSRIFEALQKLKENERTLLTFYSEGLSYKELAEITGIKFSSVGKTLSRALKKLKDEAERRK